MQGRLEQWCIDCWKERRGKVKPKQVPSPHNCKCFVCGKENMDGIYVKVDDKEVSTEDESEAVAR